MRDSTPPDHRPRINGRPYSPAIAEAATLIQQGVCVKCEGTGEIRIGGYSLDTYRGAWTLDPQMDDVVECDRCRGTGKRTSRSAA